MSMSAAGWNMTAEQRLRGEHQLANGDALTLVQVTDTHLMATPGGRLLNVDTDDSLAAVIELVLQQQSDTDALLITGDISGDGADSAYGRLAQALSVVPAPSFWLPGNHDECRGDETHADRFIRVLSNPHWLVVLLDSQLSGEVGGYLAAPELEALSRSVDRANQEGKHLLVATHHPLHPLGCDWLDPQRVANAAAFEVEVERCRQQVVVVSGHVHQASDQRVGSARYLTTPSTCVQFAPNQVEFKVDDAAPGYRWLRLSPQGQVETGVERVTHRSFPVDLGSAGYL